MSLVDLMEQVLFETGEQLLPPLVIVRLLLAKGMWGGAIDKGPTSHQIREVARVARRYEDKFTVELRAGKLHIGLRYGQ